MGRQHPNPSMPSSRRHRAAPHRQAEAARSGRNGAHSGSEQPGHGAVDCLLHRRRGGEGNRTPAPVAAIEHPMEVAAAEDRVEASSALRLRRWRAEPAVLAAAWKRGRGGPRRSSA